MKPYTRYAAVHAALALALLVKLDPDEYAGASHIAKEVGAPRNYLGKLLKHLAEEGILESKKGFGGGFRLALPADEITLFDILEPVDRVSKWNGCFLGRTECTDESPCAVHDRWSRIRTEYLQFLNDTTIAELAKIMCH